MGMDLLTRSQLRLQVQNGVYLSILSEHGHGLVDAQGVEVALDKVGIPLLSELVVVQVVVLHVPGLRKNGPGVGLIPRWVIPSRGLFGPPSGLFGGPLGLFGSLMGPYGPL